MTVERWVDCPRCGHRVRLTVDELASKRGFCATCDARFELGTESQLGDGPGRELVHVPTALAIAPPPGDRLVVRRAFPLEVELWSRRSRTLCAVASGATAIMLAWATWIIVIGGGLMSTPCLMFATILAVIAWEWRPRHDTLEVHPGGIEVRSGGRVTGKLAVDDKSDLSVAKHALVVTTDQATLEVGTQLQLLPDELRWLRDAVRAAARRLPET